jgi:hypothetical protein
MKVTYLNLLRPANLKLLKDVSDQWERTTAVSPERSSSISRVSKGRVAE